MIGVTGGHNARVARTDDPAGDLRLLLVLAEQVATAHGERTAVRELFASIRDLVDELAHQAAAAHPTESDIPTCARTGGERPDKQVENRLTSPAKQGGTGFRLPSRPH